MTADGLLAGRRIVVTGASGGIGAAVAQELAGQGASLFLLGRRAGVLRRLAEQLPGGPHDHASIDITREKEWLEVAERITPRNQLHGLVTAAAELGPVGPVGSWTIDAFRRAIDVNLVGTLLPIVTMLEALTAARGAVVTFSGGGATGPLPRYDAYAASKAAVVRLTENLASELEASGTRVNCVAPGFVKTAIHRATLEAGPDIAGDSYYRTTVEKLSEGGDPPELAAKLTALLLSDESRGVTGRLLSARWDPWQEPGFIQRLRDEPDLATLRRIDDHFFTPARQRDVQPS